MKWVLWYPTFLATPESKVAQQHPNWLIPGQETLEQSIPGTVDWQRRLLDDSVRAWGDYQWRYDIAPAASANDTDALAADQNFRELAGTILRTTTHRAVLTLAMEGDAGSVTTSLDSPNQVNIRMAELVLIALTTLRF